VRSASATQLIAKTLLFIGASPERFNMSFFYGYSPTEPVTGPSRSLASRYDTFKTRSDTTACIAGFAVSTDSFCEDIAERAAELLETPRELFAVDTWPAAYRKIRRESGEPKAAIALLSDILASAVLFDKEAKDKKCWAVLAA
jgi:hypothetical protein